VVVFLLPPFKSRLGRVPQVGSDGLLWVWPEAGAGAAARAAAVPLPGALGGPEAQDMIYIADWFVRDVPFNADVLAENILDPSHVAFSHHGILGNRYKVGPPGTHSHPMPVNVGPSLLRLLEQSLMSE
jgi:phenylpropionate dioxygenase-like ring-hydroxylating dioxygenase large terminal subunit